MDNEFSSRLYLGLEGHQEQVVTEELTASHLGSGSVSVFATPMMISLMEHTCERSVKPLLNEGDDTVGIHVNVSHDAACPVGMKVWCDSSLVDIDRRKLTFKVQVFCERGLVGEGTHERFIIHTEKFLAKIH